MDAAEMEARFWEDGSNMAAQLCRLDITSERQERTPERRVSRRLSLEPMLLHNKRIV